MNSTKRRTNALADLKSHAANLRREIAGYEVKIEIYASECSDGADTYANELRPFIDRARAALRDTERLIREIESAPRQLSLL